jgi:hypothetical protein
MWYFRTVQTMWYFRTVQTMWYFRTVQTMWYFRTVQTMWYFRTVLTMWYFRTVQTMWYFRTVQTMWYFRTVQTMWYFRIVAYFVILVFHIIYFFYFYQITVPSLSRLSSAFWFNKSNLTWRQNQAFLWYNHKHHGYYENMGRQNSWLLWPLQGRSRSLIQICIIRTFRFADSL